MNGGYISTPCFFMVALIVPQALPRCEVLSRELAIHVAADHSWVRVERKCFIAALWVRPLSVSVVFAGSLAMLADLARVARVPSLPVRAFFAA